MIDADDLSMLTGSFEAAGATDAAFHELGWADLLAMVAAVQALYPAATVMLAGAVDGERPQRVQWIGMVLALGAVMLVAVGGKAYPGTHVDVLASLPTREQALTMLVSLLAQPATMLVRVLAEPASQVARVINQVGQTKAA